MEQVTIGVIGGSGLYHMSEITDKETIAVDTPFGKPSGDIVVGTLRGKRVAFLPRHGEGHYHIPSEIPYRANIYALKSLGVRFIIAVNACGSLKEEVPPGSILVPDQIFDFTKSERGGRSFFDSGLVGHVSVADPLSPELSQQVYEAARKVEGSGAQYGGTFIVIEGPRFSTKGESRIYRQWGCSIIGMTTCPEVFLAAEAEIAYAVIAHVTDYDVWHESTEPVTVEMVMETMQKNINNVQETLALTVENLDEAADFPAHHTLDYAVMTAPQAISSEVRERVSLLLGDRFLAS
jgi:5'-methylthioadenosine phosphorylase